MYLSPKWSLHTSLGGQTPAQNSESLIIMLWCCGKLSECWPLWQRNHILCHCQLFLLFYPGIGVSWYFTCSSCSISCSTFFFSSYTVTFFFPDKETEYELETSLEDSQDEYEGNKDAARALMRVKQKLDGYEEGEMRSIHGQVILYFLFLF